MDRKIQPDWLRELRSEWRSFQNGRLFTADRKIKKNRKLLHQIDADLAKVAPVLTAAYLILFLVVPAKLPVSLEISTVPGVLLSGFAAYTLLLGQRFEHLYGAGPRRWRERMLISILCTSALWICFVVIAHRFASTDSLRLLLFGLTLAITSYLAFALVAFVVVVKLVLVMTLIPLGLLWSFENELTGWIVCITTLLYSVLLMRKVSRINTVFWQNYENKQNLQTTIRALTQAQHDEDKELEAKYRILFGIGHEFRTPINGIVGLLASLNQDNLNSDQKKHLEVADRSAQHLLSLVDLLLEQSEIGSSPTAEQSVFSLDKEIDACVEQVTPLATEKGIELWVVYARDMPHRVKGNPIRIKQILTNLITNVLQVNENNRVIILVDMQRGSGKEGRLKIEVFDEDFTLARFESNNLVNQFNSVGKQGSIRTDQLGSVISEELAISMGGSVGISKNNDRASLWFTTVLEVSSQQNRSFSPHPKMKEKRVVLLGFSEWAAKSLTLILDSWSMDIILDPTVDALMADEVDLLILDRTVPLPVPQAAPIIRLIPYQPSGGDSAPDSASDAAGGLALESNRKTEHRDGGKIATLTFPVIEEHLHLLVVQMLDLKNSHDIKEQDRETRDQDRQAKWQQRLVREQNILLVEDDPANQLATEKMLHNLGYQVDIASNGHEALVKLEQRDFDLVLMDCQLPGMSGYETAGEIKKQKLHSTRKPPILAFSANLAEGEEDRCRAAGMDGYLVKPMHADDLDFKLRQYLT